MSAPRRQELTPLKREACPRRLAAFDCEGTGAAGGFVCGAVVSDQEAVQFTAPRDMLGYLTSARFRGYWIFAHNLEYDLGVLTSGDFSWLSCLFAGTRLLWAEAQDEAKHKWRFCDSCNIFTSDSIADLGLMVGRPKIDLHPVLAAHLQAGRQLSELPLADRRQVLDYNLRDAEILFRALEVVQEELLTLGGELRPTAAGISMDLFRRQYLSEPWPTPHPGFNELARLGYHGARVEPHRLGRVEGVTGYDYRSLYPSVQATLEFPDPASLVVDVAADGRSSRLERPGLSQATILVPDCPAPPLPVSLHGKLFFPTGELAGVWPHVEIRHALECGATVQKIHWSLWSPKTFNPFEEFIDDLYRRRLLHASDGDLRARLFKLLLLSAYGRYGINPENSLSALQPVRSQADIEAHPGADFRLIGDRPYLLVPLAGGEQPAYCNVAIAATVTAGARVVMHRAISRRVEQLCYIDTDSVWVDGELETGEGLGSLRVTHEKRDLWVVAPKEYAIFSGEHLQEAHAKGVPDALAFQYLERGKVAFRSPLGIREALIRDAPVATWALRLRERRFAWPKRPPDLARGKQGEWWPTRPWECSEIRALVEGKVRPPGWPEADPAR
jgi:hypothetical protein